MPAGSPQLDGYSVLTDTTLPSGDRAVVFRPVPVAPVAPTIRVRVADAITLIPLADLTDGGTFWPGEGLIVDPAPGFAALRFVVDGQLLPRIEANPPLAVWGDAGGHLLPHGLSAGGHTLTVWAYGSILDAQAQAQARIVASRTIDFVVQGVPEHTPTPTPTPTPPPVIVVGPTPTPATGLPALTRKVAPATGRPRFGVGLTSGGPQVLHDTHLEGYGSNISYERVASVDIRNVRSVDAYRDDPAWTFGGQGLYVDLIHGPVTVAGYFGYRNGWQPDKPATDRSMFRHAFYANFGATAPTVTDYLAVSQPAAGILLRNGGTVDRFACLDCGIGVEASQGVTILSNGLIYGGGYYADFAVDPKTKKVTGVKAWTGMIPVSSDAVVHLKSVLIVARPNQALGDSFVQRHAVATGAHRYFGPALSANYKASDPGHLEWVPPPRGVDQITCEDVHVVGWPLKPDGSTNIFGGNGQQSRKGVMWHPTSVQYDYMPVVNAVLRNTLSIPDAIAELRADVARLIK